ncbi:unnamed protein product [Hanseniaspora opuntiae]
MSKKFSKKSKQSSKRKNKNRRNISRTSRDQTPEPAVAKPEITTTSQDTTAIADDSYVAGDNLNNSMKNTDPGTNETIFFPPRDNKKNKSPNLNSLDSSPSADNEVSPLLTTSKPIQSFNLPDMESVKSVRSIKSQYEDVTNDIPGLIINEILSHEEIVAGQSDLLSNDLESGTPPTYGSMANDKIITAEEPQMADYQKKLILVSMYLGILLAALDVSVISTLLSHIASEFNALDKITQIVSAYLLSSATVQPLYGKISDIYGRKSVLIVCNIIFALGCFLCGQPNNSFDQLIWGRILQGIGGSGLTSVATITTSDLVSLKDRAFYQGIGNFFYAIGIASGGVIGGILNDKFNWRFSFMIQVPISILSLIMIIVFMKLPNGSKRYTGLSNFQKLKAIDWTGSFVLMAFLFTFSYGGSYTMYFISFVLLLLLTKIETSLTSKEPILPIHFLKNKSVFGAAWSNFLVMATSVTCMFYLPMYWTTILDLSTTETGLRLAPNFFSTAFGSLGAGLYMKKTGKYYWFLMTFCLVGILGCLRLVFITPDIVVWQQYLCLVVPGFAMSVMITINLLIMIAAVPQEDQAACTSISYAFRSTGSTVGISLAGLIFSKTLHSQLIKRVLPLAGEEHSKKTILSIIENAEKSSDYIKTAAEWVRPVLKTCFHYALKNTFIFTFVCFLLATSFVSICEEFQLYGK